VPLGKPCILQDFPVVGQFDTSSIALFPWWAAPETTKISLIFPWRAVPETPYIALFRSWETAPEYFFQVLEDFLSGFQENLSCGLCN
jgi:hypothetical protein